MDKDLIQFVGLSKLKKEEKEVLNRLSTEYFQQIKRCVKNLTKVKVNIKEYKTSGKTTKKKKFSINVQVNAPTHSFESTKTSDWDLARALHKAYKDVIRVIQHRMKDENPIHKC